MAALHVELQAIKGFRHNRHGAGSDVGLPRSMRLEVPRFNGSDSESCIFAIHDYFDLLGTAVEQRLKSWVLTLKGTPPSGFVMLQMQGLAVEVDLYVPPMKGADVVLGIQWLQKLGKGDALLRMKQMSLHRMQELLDMDEVYGVCELHGIPILAEEAKKTLVRAPETPPEIEWLLASFDILFQVPTTLPPHRLIDHRIHLLPNTKLVNVRPYHYPHYQKVKKKDGSYRFCVDYQALNAVTIKDKLPIPTADGMLDELGGAVIFTKLDLQAGYHQIRDHQFYVKRLKCVFGAATLEYLGHIISKRGVKIDPKKVAAVVEWPEPKTSRQVWSFLVEATAFNALKRQLSHAPVLGLPNFDETFMVETDASADGIRAVLLQKGQPLSFFSRKLGPRMHIAATYQKELFAIVKAVYKWRKYLVGCRFIIRTDHKNIKELMQQVIQMPLPTKDHYYIGAESKLKQTLLSEFHSTPSAGHEGVKKMLVGLSALFYWKGMYRFSKYANFGTLPTSFNVVKVAKLFVEMVVKHHGFPKTVVSDRDPIFISKFWKHLFMASGTQLNYNTTYHPQTEAEHFCNTSYHSSIKMSLFQALYGRLPSAIIPYPPGSSKLVAVDEVLTKRDELLKQLRHNLLVAKHHMEMKAIRSRRDVEFNKGDKDIPWNSHYPYVTHGSCYVMDYHADKYSFNRRGERYNDYGNYERTSARQEGHDNPSVTQGLCYGINIFCLGIESYSSHSRISVMEVNVRICLSVFRIRVCIRLELPHY
nr:transposon Ty3-G Gag-Pol polyprotein [Tanacetum cinerariifolium]